MINFIELGAFRQKTLNMLNMRDLIKMDMNKKEVLSFKTINPNI